MKSLPEFLPKPERKKLTKSWACPGCGLKFKSSFNGESVSFIVKSKIISRCGGLYESVEITCPNCGGAIIFTKGELEAEAS